MRKTWEYYSYLEFLSILIWFPLAQNYWTLHGVSLLYSYNILLFMTITYLIRIISYISYYLLPIWLFVFIVCNSIQIFDHTSIPNNFKSTYSHLSHCPFIYPLPNYPFSCNLFNTYTVIHLIHFANNDYNFSLFHILFVYFITKRCILVLFCVNQLLNKLRVVINNENGWYWMIQDDVSRAVSALVSSLWSATLGRISCVQRR